MAKGRLFTFILGAAVGAGAIIFSQSEEGKKLIKSVKDKGRELMDEFEEWEEEEALDSQENA